MTTEKITYIKFLVGTRLWLVPSEVVTEAFIAAVERLNNTEQGKAVEWTDEEKQAFDHVDWVPQVYKPL
jgi:hypothetical protein